MAKKVDDDLADPYERVIRDMIPMCRVFKGAEEDNWSNTDFLQGWTLVPIDGSPLNALGYESSIDLSGYANQSLTFFPQTGFLQTALPYRVNTDADDGTGLCQIVTLVSTVPLDLSIVATQIITSTGPGLLSFRDANANVEDYIDWSQLLWGQIEYRFANNTLSDPSFMQLQEVSQIGSLSATAADKLYVYALGIANGVAMTSFTIPAMRIGFMGQMAEEPTLEYMMRLANSYQLANQV